MRRQLFICLLLAGITLAIYWPVRHYGIIYYDDPFFISETPEINAGLNWHSLWWALSGVLVANWHPVTSLSFVVTHTFWGSESRRGASGERVVPRGERGVVVSRFE